MRQQRSAVRLIREEPVGLRDDAFGFGAYAETLAAAARESTQPLTIGVFGEWGTGKSSLMKMIVDHLADDKRVVTVECNAWQFQHEEQPLFPLVASVVRRFDDHRSSPQALESVADELRRAADEVDEGRSDVPPLTSVRAGPADMSARLDALLERSQYAEAFELMRSVDVPDGWRFVVVVDDLDRCSPERAVRLLESIKLVLDQPGFVFVIGVSRRVIEEHLEHLYRDGMGIASFEGSSYLEKLVQIPFPIPPYREKIGGLTDKLAERLDDIDLSEMLPLLAKVFDYNPRALIRVINSLIIDRSINENLSAAGLMEPVPLQMFAVSRALQHRWEPVHRLLELAGPGLAEEIMSWSTIPIPVQADNEDENYVANAMNGAPALVSLLHSPAGLEWLGNDEMRRAAAEFVEEHRRDLSDTFDEVPSIDVFISSSSADREAASVLREALTDRGYSVFESEYSVTAGAKIVDAVTSGLHSARTVLYLHGNESTQSHWQQQEIESALREDESRRASWPTIIPVLLPDVDSSELPQQLRSIQSLSLDGLDAVNVSLVVDDLQRAIGPPSGVEA